MTGKYPNLDLVNKKECDCRVFVLIKTHLETHLKKLTLILSISIHIQNFLKICTFVLKMLNRNDILTSIKGHNCVANLWKMPGNNPNLNLHNMNAYIKFGEILFFLKILRGNKILTSIKSHDSVINLWKVTANYLNLDFVNIKAYIKFGQILPICFKDIDRKQNFDIN